VNRDSLVELSRFSGAWGRIKASEERMEIKIVEIGVRNKCAFKMFKKLPNYAFKPFIKIFKLS
jgi:hypothetical protein